MSTIVPIINAKPINPTQEKFQSIQKFGLQPYDRAPNDYLRFVAKIFTAWRDPNDNILNLDPFDDKYGVDTGTSLTLQATADKSIIAYVDGFEADYHFVRLTTDSNSTDLTMADNVIPSGTGLNTFVSESGDVITIDESKYGEYHRFLIQPGICFIDNQLVQIVEETEWWFRVPKIKDFDSNGLPTYELGQFIVDPLKVYSLLPNKNYKIILSYEYINQFESNSARLRFETDETAIDEPYFLIGSFTTNEFGMVHQTEPINEKSLEKFKHYIVREDINPTTGNLENFYYLKDLNPQYLDKKYMSNHKNLFKHLQSQLLTVLSESKISNVFHCKEIKEEIDPSVSSGDMVYYDGYTKRWYPAEVSRQDFDRVVGLYLKNSSEGTHFLFTSGIIEIDDTFTIIDSENLILRNLIPGAEYFLAEDTNTALNTAPFIDSIIINDERETGYFSISTEVIAKASSIEIEMIPTPNSGLPAFSRKRTFVLDPNLGEQRISQTISWLFSPSELAGLPILKLNGIGPIQTEKITFNVKLNMVESEIVEKEKEIIEEFKLQDTGDIEIEYIENEGLPNEVIHILNVEESKLYINTNGIPSVILPTGPSGSPIMKLLEVLGITASKDYPGLGIIKDSRFVPDIGSIYNLDDIENELRDISNDLSSVIYNSSPANFGLYETMAILGNEVTKIDKIVSNLKEAKTILEDNYKAARLKFQSEESSYQIAINSARNDYMIVKNTYDSLVSQQFILTQKKNAVQVKLDEINLEISSLAAAKASLGGATINLTTLSSSIQAEITTLQTDIANLNTDITNLNNSIVGAVADLATRFNGVQINQLKSFDFKSSYYSIANALSISSTFIDLTDKTLILQRSFNNLKLINDLTIQSETERIILETSKLDYLTTLDTYTNNVLNGSLDYANQLLAANDVIVKKTIFDEDQANYNTTINRLVDARTVRDDHIKPMFDKAKDAIRAELFVKVTPTTTPNPIYGNAHLTEYTIKLSRPATEVLYFDFVYKEDTNDTMRITIPIGDTQASSSVYLQAIPDTKVDAGVPKWITSNIYNQPVDYIFNVNKFNQRLIDSHVLLKGTDTVKGEPELFTLDIPSFEAIPYTMARPTQTGSKLRGILDLDNLFQDSLNIHNIIDQREININDRTLKENLKISKENEETYKQLYKDAIDQQIALGTSTMNEYDVQITNLNTLHTYYKSSPETVDINLIGSNYSFDVCTNKLSLITVQLLTYGTDLSNKQIAYQTSLDNLRDATDVALGEFVDGIAESNTLIIEKEKTKEKIKAMFNLYKERTEIVINIYNNLKNILESGMFNNEWIDTSAFLINGFQYQNALTNQLLEIIDDTLLIPISSIIIPKILTYTIGTNGLQYPMDLQPWIFVKTSGKISTKNYPGATSVGIALNQNTLILNIKHNKCGDISEFLNVYGNETNFIDQLTAKYKSSKSAKTKLEVLSANVKVQTKINEYATKLEKNQSIVTRNVNGKTITITTSLIPTEMDTLDLLVQGLVSNNDGSVSDTNISYSKKEFLIRLIYSKYFGSGNWYNPQEYLYKEVDSTSSWFTLPGNIFLMTGKDPFNPEQTGTGTGQVANFGAYIQKLYNTINGTTLSQTTLKRLFQEKLPLYKDLDILNYILAILPEPLIDYNAKFTKLKAHYKNLYQQQMTIARLTLLDNPLSTNDDFEDPSNSDTFIMDPARIATVRAQFDTLTASANVSKNLEQTKITNDRIDHNYIIDKISKYDFYKTFLISLREDILGTIRYYEEKLKILQDLKVYFTNKIIQYDKDYLIYYNKMNLLPNTMWDIFRINNYQRTKWNYTYLVLRILGIQKELNNIIKNNSIQFSPINSELAELNIKLNAAISAGETSQAYAYDTHYKALQQKKTNFYNLLQNMVNEFNVIQQKYSKPTITAETPLEPSFIIDELYMQDPNEYNLSYSFASYPAYKELA